MNLKPFISCLQRRVTAIAIEEASKELRLPKIAVATALVFFHRFYALQSFKKHPRHDMAVACLFLASKVEESGKKPIDVILAFDALWNGQDSDHKPLVADSPEGEARRVLILKCERLLLHTLSFDLCVEHPYKFLIDTVKSLHHGGAIEESVKKELGQRAVCFLNDSLRTSLCLQFAPNKVGGACIYLAAAFLDVRVAPAQAVRWDKALDINEVELAVIVEQLMSQYSEQIRVDAKMVDLEERLVERGVLPERSVAPETKRQRIPPVSEDGATAS